jgi:hypothetical protein
MTRDQRSSEDYERLLGPLDTGLVAVKEGRRLARRESDADACDS